MPLDNLGPVKFSIEGTFMDKPRLLMNGEEVPFDTLGVVYYPAETFEMEGLDGKTEKKELPEYIDLSFSLKANVGQLEAYVSYRVKANEEGKFVVAKREDLVREDAKQQLKKVKKVKLDDGEPVNVQKKLTVDKVVVEGKEKEDKEEKKDAPKKEEKDGEKPKKGEKPDFKKFKKGKSSLNPDSDTRMYKKQVWESIVENIVEDEK
jgi:hypothetical protein